MSWLRGAPQIATETDLKARWGGAEPGKNFRCHLCGYRFQLGDRWRCVYTNDMEDGVPGGNPLVCVECDTGTEGVRAEWKRMREVMDAPKWWTFRRGQK